MVRDPCHPLYGRRFRAAARPTGTVAFGGQNILVFYREDVQLRLPVAALNAPRTGQALPTKLTGSSIAELVTMVRALQSGGEGEGRPHCKQGDEHARRSKPTLGCALGRAQGANSRRSRGRASGGAR